MISSYRTVVDDIAERLRNSSLPLYRRATFIGFRYGESRFPVLMPDEGWESGIWILGGARTGKTQRVIASLGIQRIARNDCPVVFLDLKGDDALFQCMRLASEAAGRQFWFFSTAPRFPTQIFNPLTQEHLSDLSRSSKTDLLLTSMNLMHGFDYGKLHFMLQSRGGMYYALRYDPASKDKWGAPIKIGKANSFADVERRLREVVKKHPELRNAESLSMLISQLAGVPQLNGDVSSGVFPDSALTQSIQLSGLLRRDTNNRYPVLYSYLRTESDPLVSSLSGKLQLNLLKNAIRQLLDNIKLGVEPGPAPNVVLFIDECQMVLDDALKNMLEQGASLGLQFVLANQDVSQLHVGERNYLPTVWENCGNKIILSSRDNPFVELLMKLSGEKAIHHLSYQVDQCRAVLGEVGPEHAIDLTVQVSEMPGPRMERNLLIEMSATPGRAMFIPAQNVPLAMYDGYPILIDIPFVHSRETFESLKAMPWPAPTPATIVPRDLMARWEEYLEK